jgi:hypothetical protein
MCFAAFSQVFTMETEMADNLQQRGGRDRQRIDVNEDYELRDWSKKFGVTKEQLKEAVKAVGNESDKVEQFLKGRERSGSGASSERGGSGSREKR